MGVEDVISSYFGKIFTSSRPSPECIEAAFEGVVSKVTPAMNEELIRPFEGEEVKKVLFKIGFPTLFYQRHWDVVGELITNV